MTFKERVYEVFQASSEKYTTSWWIDIFLIVIISLNGIAIVLESLEPLRARFETGFYVFEVFSVTVFSLEYIIRVWCANSDPRFKKLFSGNIRYMFTPMAIIDVLAVLPFFLPLIGADLRSLRILRLFRFFRIFKVARYIKALRLIDNVFKDKREELFISIVFTLFMLLVTSSVMYYVENDAQPENFSSIPQTMWWGIATLTTVGYGDVYPITGLGKLLGGVIAVLGIGLFALPTGILASGFSDQISKSKNDPLENYCPTCGKKLDE